MKKRLIAGIILALMTAGVYYIAYQFIFPSDKKTIIYLVPIFALALIALIFLIWLIAFNNFIKQDNALIKELAIKNDLLDSLQDSNNIVAETLPIGMVVYSRELTITYANIMAKNLFQSSLLGKDISRINDELYQMIVFKKASHVIDVYGKKINVIPHYEKQVVYFFDVTKSYTIEANHKHNIPCLMIVSLENVKALEDVSFQQKTELLNEFYIAIDKWAVANKAYSLSNSGDRQVFIIKKGDLDLVKRENFSILQDVNAISMQEQVPISVSIGVGIDDDDYSNIFRNATKALDSAGQRGGNQAVIFDGQSEVTYGGRNRTVERKTAAEVQNYASEIFSLIKEASSIIVMPHKKPDADALGSAIGVRELCEQMGTPAKVFIDYSDIDDTVAQVIDDSAIEYIKLRQDIITEQDYKEFFKGRTLLIMVDHHSKDRSASKAPYRQASKVAIIDHHRLEASLDTEPDLVYIDHNASSAVELVTEILTLAPVDIKLPKFIATSMFVGMLIDTQNFTAHTSEKMFYIAGKLAQYGADPYKAKLYLREPIAEQSARINALLGAEKVFNNMRIIKLDGKQKGEDLSKAAEALLNSDKGVIATFAIGRLEDGRVGISARSDGSYNVSHVMQLLGGGGHFNASATQIDEQDISQVKKSLVAVLEQELKGDERSMRVILVADVKKQGRKGETIDVTPGYGNYLLSKGLAIEANAANIAALEEEKARKEQQIKEEIEVANKIKSTLDGITVIIPVKTGEKGKLFGSITSSNVQAQLKSQYKLDIDKKKIIIHEEKITSLGTYDVSVKLQKDISAKFHIDVVEAK